MNLPHLRGIRQRAILSQEELAAKSGVARDTISKLETGRRKAYPSTIRKLAGGLEIAPQMLMGGVEYFDDAPEVEGTEGFEGSQAPQEAPEEGKGRRIGF